MKREENTSWIPMFLLPGLIFLSCKLYNKEGERKVEASSSTHQTMHYSSFVRPDADLAKSFDITGKHGKLVQPGAVLKLYPQPIYIQYQ